MSGGRGEHRSPAGNTTASFAVECPGCYARVAVPTALVGHAAVCPACRAAFLTPPAEREEQPVPESVKRPKRRRRKPVLPDVATEPSALGKSASSEPAGAQPPPADATPLGETSRPPSAPRAEPPRDGEPLVFSEPPPPSTRRRGGTAVEAPPHASAADTAAPAAPWAEPEHPQPAARSASGELAFREPVRMIQSGGTEIELRRLTPEERRARRARRNLLFLVVGAALLVALVLLLGKGGR